MDTKQPEFTANERRNAVIALVLLVPIPSLGIACEMLWFPGTLGLSILGFTKLWILLLPLIWSVIVDRRKIAVTRPTTHGVGLGWLSGLAGSILVVIVFHFVLRDRIDPALVRDMASKNHLLTHAAYTLVAIYTCAANSLLEEYVWRWFVLGKFEKLLPRRVAVAASAVAFMLHHTLLLALQFGAEIAVIGSIAVFIAGVTWSSIYARTRSIWSVWASHALIDIAVFWAGWQLLFVG